MRLHDQLVFDEQLPPGTPTVGTAVAYARLDGGIYSKDDTGLEQPLGGVFVQETNPGMTRPGMWFQTDASGNLVTLWVQT